MTDELKLSEVSWGDHRVRFIELDGGKYIPVGDLAKATGVRKRSYHNLMDKYPDEFKVHERGVKLSSPGGAQETRCIDPTGAYNLLKLVSANYIKDPDTRKKVIEFKEWMHQRVMGKTELSTLPTPKPKPDFDHILQELRFIKTLSKETGWDLNELRIAALRDHGLYSLAMVGEKSKPAEPPLALPAPPSQKPKGYYNASDIGLFAGKKAEEINQWLYNNQFIIHDDENPGEWRITDAGREFGEEHSYNPPNSLRIVWRCFWKPAILEKMNLKVPG